MDGFPQADFTGPIPPWNRAGETAEHLGHILATDDWYERDLEPAP